MLKFIEIVYNRLASHVSFRHTYSFNEMLLFENLGCILTANIKLICYRIVALH